MVKKYWRFLQNSFAGNLEFRGALIVWFLVELLTLISSIFIWTAIFRSNNTVGSYNYQSIVQYYLLVPLIGAFTSIYISEHLPERIRLGEISIQVIKPYNVALGYLFRSLGTKLVQLTFKLPVYFLIYLLIIAFTPIRINLFFLALSLFIALFSLLLHFLIDFCLSCVAFWSDHVWYLSHLKFIMLMVFGGLTFPLDLLPIQLTQVFYWLPFKYLYYLPVKVASGNFNQIAWTKEILLFLTWISIFLILSKLLWKKGLIKYGAYGN